MKYFFDTEFIEGFINPFMGKRRHFIDLISIGIVAEDGRTYYAISNEFREKDANPWVRENVLSKLPPRIVNITPDIIGDPFRVVYEKNGLYKTNKQIAKEIIEFVNPGWLGEPVNNDDNIQWTGETQEFIRLHNAKAFDFEGLCDYYFAQPEFYAYYADYDWVIFCSLFGTMMQLPKGFPMYCRDIKQIVDDWVQKAVKIGPIVTTIEEVQNPPKQKTFDEWLNELKAHPNYPVQTDEHNALDDAKWNFELYKFITS